jgi:hypothetical protein
MDNPETVYVEKPLNGVRLSWILVTLCGLLFGYYILQTYFTPQQRQYQLNFGAANWIEPGESQAPIAYFRKEIYLPSLPQNAWLQIAGSDNFGLSINGRTVGNANSVKSYETGIFDIKRPLKAGTNVIAASVSRTSWPGVAQLLVRGEITLPGGKVIPILSDETWRVTNRTGIIPGSEEWNSVRVEDEVWPNARRSPLNDEKPSLRWVDTNPILLQLPREGNWIMADNAALEAVFSTVFKADRAKQETWIQVASSGDLDLEVNGHIVTLASIDTGGAKKLPRLPIPEPTPENTKPGLVAQGIKPKEKGSPFQPTELSAYDISYWIKRGPNVIVAAVRNDKNPAAFLADGITVKADGTVSRFSTNQAWRIGEHPEETKTANARHVVELGKDGIAPWGYLPQEIARPLSRSGFATLVNSLLIIGLAAGAVVALWLIVSGLVSDWRKEPLARSMARDALLHGPVIAGLLLITLPNWDPRFPTDWSFQPLITIGAFAVLLLLRLLHLLPASENEEIGRERIGQLKARAGWEDRSKQVRAYISNRLRLPELFEIPFRELLPYIVLILIMFLGFGFRYHEHALMSFDHDEMGLISKSKGILTLGFPYTKFGNQIRWLTTYEAVPYPLAFVGLIFGYSEWSLRLPAVFFGTMTIGLLGFMGKRLFNWRTGLFVALIYACLPLNIRWGQNAFYPSQCQFMATLTFFLFYETIRTRPLNRKFLTAATVTFCLTYLSWEGPGFIVPALLLGLLVVRWGEWWWLKEFHLYRCIFFIGAVVVAQYCSRMYAGNPYLLVGSGLSNLTGPSLFFLAPGYQPLFYVDKLLLSENHVFFTVMTFLGLPFCWKQPGFRYVFVLLAVLFTLHTNFLAALSPRYCYYFQPMLLLAGVGATITLYDRLLALARQTADWNVPRIAAHVAGFGLLALLFVQSNESVLKEYTLSSTGDTPQMMTRMGTYRYDYRGAADYVRTHARPGDVILPGIPHVFNFYTGLNGDYFLNTLFSSKVGYQPFAEPRFADKFLGLPVIRNVTELRDAVNRAGRAWVLFVPYSSFERLNSPAVLDYIHQNSKAEFESYRAKVYLIQRAQPERTVAQIAE